MPGRVQSAWRAYWQRMAGKGLMSGTCASIAEQAAQNPSFSKLIRILNAEHKDGCRNRVVMGGLEKFLAVWFQEVEAAEPAGQEALVAEVMNNLQGYAQKPIVERFGAIKQAITALETRLPPGTMRSYGETVRESAQRKRKRLQQPEIGLKSPVTAAPRVTAAQARKLQQLGVHTIEDLLYFFPRRYDDFSKLRTISELQYGEEATVIGVIEEAKNQQTPRGIRLTKAIISDGTGYIEATWFNQPYLVQRLLRGRRIVLSGRVDEYLGRLTFQSPVWEPWTGDFTHTGRLVPVYPLVKGLTARPLRNLIKAAVTRWAPQLVDSLPAELRRNYDLLDLTTAVQQIHFPDDKASLEHARRRLCFEEFLLIQLGVQRQRFLWQQQRSKPMVVDWAALDSFINALPFALTSAQRRVLSEIVADMQRPYPMSRLLQGDVGSGKTVVALAAMLVAVTNGMQAAFMAPTEVLAEQHYRTLTKILQDADDKLRDVATASLLSRARVGLLIGSLSQAEKEERHRAIADGEINIVIGTHAVIQEKVSFKDLGLAIVDEQHRFGVSQRAALRQKGYNPHVLVMSATPIPRTLALTIYGDLDLSIIDQLPPNRQKIHTKWLEPRERERAYAFVRSQVEKGHQAFIICPLIEESEIIEAKAAVTEYRRLKEQVFPDLKLGLLHGRMKNADKEAIMLSFQRGELDILVSTAVVEVGIDVPNATVMLVEGADRFGLAQLHQFRGRVGRGEYPSYCLLLAESPSTEGGQRLQIIETTHDGFLLAEEDLKMRGPGEFFGTRQAGLPDLKVAKLSDMRVLEQAREAALDLFREDPTMSQPEHQLLAQKMRDFWGARIDLS